MNWTPIKAVASAVLVDPETVDHDETELTFQGRSLGIHASPIDPKTGLATSREIELHTGRIVSIGQEARRQHPELQVGQLIAWQRDNVYWVFDGFHSSITMYDFRVDHGPAGTDHTDGIVKRYVEGAVLWLENVPSHTQFDPPGSNLLYIADTGHSRIALLDTATGVQGAPVPPNYDGTDQSRVDNAIITTFIDGLALDPVMATPSGSAIHDGHMFVTDNATSTIFAFDMQANLVDWLHTDLAPGSLMGITFDALGQLYVADALANQVVRITALPEEVLEEDAP